MDKLEGENNLTCYNGYLTREDRERLHGHKGAVIWFTGLSASGNPPLPATSMERCKLFPF